MTDFASEQAELDRVKAELRKVLDQPTVNIGECPIGTSQETRHALAFCEVMHASKWPFSNEFRAGFRPAVSPDAINPDIDPLGR